MISQGGEIALMGVSPGDIEVKQIGLDLRFEDFRRGEVFDFEELVLDQPVKGCHIGLERMGAGGIRR